MGQSRAFLRVALPAALAGLCACKAEKHHAPPAGDAAPTEDIEPPLLLEVPERTPLLTVAVRGSTEGTRVVTQGSPTGTLVTVVLPGGTFCQDTPLSDEGPTTLNYYAMTGDGRVSQPASVEVTRDPAAPQPTVTSCTGVTEDCEDTESCNNSDKDDDCNGWADECDLPCNGCTDDAYEPNDLPINVPTLLPDTYDLQLCPCHDDWFAFTAGEGDTIHAAINFVSATIDIDAALYRPGPEGQGVTEPPVQTAATTSNTEVIDYEVPTGMGGTYYMRVYPYHADDKPSGSYTLTVP